MILQASQSILKELPIEDLWYVNLLDIAEDKRKDTIVPIGQLHIVYNFADSYQIMDEGGYKQVPNQVLVGQLKEPAKIKYGAHVKQLGIAIGPSYFYRLFGQVASLYSDVVMNSSQLPFLSQLHEHVQRTMHDLRLKPDQQIEQIADYFRNIHLLEAEAIDIDGQIQYIEDHDGVIDVRQMADYFHYSLSSFERNFKKYTGLTPKVYGDIIRFRKAVLEDNPERFFYDQSHYIKNCKKYTWKIPERLRRSKEISVRHMLGLESADFIQ